MRTLALRLAVWIVLALVVVLPRGGLTGHPDIDVWNHAWGLWWVADCLRHGTLPWATELVAAPAGGVLYFIDPVGALAAAPVTLLFGPQVAYEALLVAQVAFAGLAAQALAEELVGEGPHGWFAGVAYATTPMLLCELYNGITEVAAVGWVPAALWAARRAVRLGRPRDAALLGGVLGLTVLANFYYGLTVLLAVGVYALAVVRSRRAALGGVLALGLAAAIAGPGVLALRASLTHPQALISRPEGLNRELAEHNAVDPLNYVAPGDAWSVDLARRYGEAFRHTGQLRLAVLALAVVGVWRDPRRRGGWAAMAVASLVIGLGPQLWHRGHFVVMGRGPVGLPFLWLQAAVPGLAITHPQRLSIVAQALVCGLGAGALVGRPRWVVAALSVAAAVETARFTLARWPLPESPAAVPALYTAIAADPDPRGVLDLPGDAGTTMATSRWFWFQTVHRRPIPYKPDARSNDNGDPETFRHLPSRFVRAPAPLDDAALTHLRTVYGWIVIHPAIGGDAAAQRAVLEAALGPPQELESRWVWRLPPP